MTETRNDRGIWMKALWLVPLIVGVGSFMGTVAGSGYGNPWFDQLREPIFMPPGWAFGVAWTTLYTMIAIALATILNEPKSEKRNAAVTLFVLQLLLNFAWSPVFFRLHAITEAKYLILAIAILAALTAGRFWRIRPLAGALMLPYLGWLIFAFVLNSAFEQLNPGAGVPLLG